MRIFFLFPLLAAIAAYQGNVETVAGPPKSSPKAAELSPSLQVASVSTPQKSLPANLIETQTLNAEPIRISITNLPNPFATNSASKPPRILPILANPVLKVPLGYYEDFLTGFLTDPEGPSTWGRPVGLLVLPDGSLLVTEEANERIYGIQHAGVQR